eukprot:744581_1
MWLFFTFQFIAVSYAAVHNHSQEICNKPFLAPSKHTAITLPSFGEIECYYFCRDRPISFYQNHEEEKELTISILCLSVIAFALSLGLCCNLCAGHFNTQSHPPSTSNHLSLCCKHLANNFKDKPFIYDIPWVLNIGYCMVTISLLIPFISTPSDIVCNADENTLIKSITLSITNIDDINMGCVGTAILNAMGIHIIGLYNSAASVLLYIKITQSSPWFNISKTCLHLLLFFIALSLCILPLFFGYVSPDWMLNICTMQHSLYFIIIPLCVYTCFTFIFLGESIIKLKDHLGLNLGNAASEQNKKVRKLYIRVVLFAVITVVSFIVYTVISVLLNMWRETHEDALKEMIECSIVHKDEMEYCSMDGMGVRKPKFMRLYVVIPAVYALLALSGFIWTMTPDNMKVWTDVRHTIEGLIHRSHVESHVMYSQDLGHLARYKSVIITDVSTDSSESDQSGTG